MLKSNLNLGRTRLKSQVQEQKKNALWYGVYTIRCNYNRLRGGLRVNKLQAKSTGQYSKANQSTYPNKQKPKTTATLKKR